MAKSTMNLSLNQLKDLARSGAVAAVQTLESQIAAIKRAFPDVFGANATRRRGRARGGRRKMSAAGRARIAAAQRARWAKVKAQKAAKRGGAKKRGGKKRGTMKAMADKGGNG